MIIISVEGNIGSGKTTLIKLLEKNINKSNFIFLLEPIDEWTNINGNNLLDCFYHDAEKYAFLFQCRVFITRIKQLYNKISECSDDSIIFIERSWFSDRMCFAQILKENNIISEMEWIIYKDMFDWVKSFCPVIDKFIYVKCSTKRALDGINKRNRNEESNISYDYIDNLNKKHDQWLLNKDNVLVIDSNIDYTNNYEYLNDIIQNIYTFINV